MDKITISVFTDIENPFSMTQCDQPDDHHCNLVISQCLPLISPVLIYPTAISLSTNRAEAAGWETPTL